MLSDQLAVGSSRTRRPRSLRADPGGQPARFGRFRHSVHLVGVWRRHPVPSLEHRCFASDGAVAIVVAEIVAKQDAEFMERDDVGGGAEEVPRKCVH